MDKNMVFNHYSNILDNMIENSLFWSTFLQHGDSIDDVEGSIDDPSFPENLQMRFGISRACLIDDMFDWVVKFDIDCDAYGDSMCEREVSLYKEAKANHLDAYFTQAVYIGTYHKSIQFYDYEKIDHYLNWCGYNPEEFDENFMKHEDDFGEIVPITINIPLFAYPRATTYRYTMFYNNEETTELENEARSISSPLRKRALQIAMEFIYKYGMEQYQKLSDFLYENSVNDLHRNNIGCVNGNLVIIDYAGYYSGDGDDEEETDC